MPVRLTEAEARQLGLFPAPQHPQRQKGAPRIKRKKQDLPENQIESQIKSFLEAHGWLVRRNQVGTYTPYRVLMAISDRTMTVEQAKRNIVRIGERGEADFLALRSCRDAGKIPTFNLFFFECKAPGKKPGPDQIEWMRKQNAVGVPAHWFDGFNDGFEGDFIPWYKSRFEANT